MERERTKRRKMEARLNNTILGPSRKKLKQAKMSTSKIKVNLVLDFSFTHLMSDKDLSNCLKQIGFCYGVNRRVDDPCQFYVTSFTGRAIEMMEKNEGYTNWDVYFREESWRDIFKKEDVVYLTSDSDNVLENIEDNKAYIIGGLVDHNAHKGLCLRIADELGVHHARLPIPEYIDMKTRKVLTINHVFEIMVNVSNKMSWKDALIKVIPVRKGALDKETDKLEENSNNNGHQIDENFCDENLLKSQDQIEEFKSSKVS